MIIIPTATKADLRKHLKAKDLEFVTLFCKPLLPSSEWLLIQKLGRSLLEGPDDANQVIANIGGQFPVTKEQLRTFANDVRLSAQCIDVLCKMFQLRDDRIAEVFHDVNHRRTNYQPFKRTVFLGNVFCSNLSNTLVLDHIQLLIAQYFPRDWKVVEDTSNLVLLMNTSLVFEHPNIDSWTMLRIDLEHRKILYCDPRLVRSPALSEFAKLSLERTRTEILIPVLRVVVPTYTGDWPLSILEHQYFPTLAATNECDCGVYLAACLYFSVNTVPVYINENGGIARLRKQLAYWILCEQLPY